MTTAAGLAALLSSPLKPLQEFGLVAAVGVLAAFGLTFTLVPALLHFAGDVGHLPKRTKGTVRTRELLRKMVAFFAHPPQRVTRAAIPVGLVVAGLGVLSATRIEIGVDPMSWFKERDPFRLATEHVDRAMGGGTAIEFLVRAPGSGLRDPAVLQQLDDFERWMERETLATACLSAVDLLKEVTRASSEGEHRVPRLPRLPVMTDMLLDALAQRGELERWSGADFSTGRISCRVPLSRAADMGEQLDLLEQELAKRFADSPLSVEPTGYGTLVVRMEDHLVQSQIRSLTIAFLAVLIMLALLVRSARIAALAMAPNLLPVVIGLGLMPLMGIGLNPGSVMVAAVALGIVVDDTAHLLVAMRRRLDAREALPDAIANAIIEVGSPLIITSLVLVGSMGVLTLGSFAPSIHFGTIAMIIVTAALFADLLLLPRLLAVWYGHAIRNIPECRS